MRPYLVLTTVVLLAVAVFGQQPFPYAGPCLYGCGPYVPMLTTPQVSANLFAESGGSKQCHHGINRRRDQLDTFAD